MAMLAYTFGTGFFAIALVVWILVWLVIAVGVVRRRDLGFVGKVFWLVVILVIHSSACSSISCGTRRSRLEPDHS